MFDVAWVKRWLVSRWHSSRLFHRYLRIVAFEERSKEVNFMVGPGSKKEAKDTLLNKIDHHRV